MFKEASEQAEVDNSSHNITVEVSASSNAVGVEHQQPTEDSAVTILNQSATADDSEILKNEQVRIAVSQPMTASTSSSSTPSLKDTPVESASPYGTRSRNRAGVSRPNYAEDRETEMELEIQPQKEDDNRKVGRSTEFRLTTEAAGPAGTFRKAIQVDYSGNGHISQKDPIPGTSSFSANPSTSTMSQPSRKRKATGQPAQSSANTLLPIINTAPSGSQSNIRKTSIATHSLIGFRDSSMLSFENCAGKLSKNEKLVADDGTTLGVNDHVYLVCEPPGEPYYLGRIMEFLHINNDIEKPIDALRINWYYRPKDIGRKVNDTRQVFASMHSDTSPLTALRGLCQIRHKSEVQNMEEYRRTQNCFWYEKLYDRYIQRYYEVIPTSQIVNVPAIVKRVLDERWKFILVESGRGKELTSAVKSCKRCGGYCASNDSVDCAVCHQTYHMNCVRPPLLKKPSRGFAWACGPCSRAQERKLEARNTPNLADTGLEVEEEELVDEEEEEVLIQGEDADTGRTSPVLSQDGEVSVHLGTPEQIYQASLWPFRYLGIHCKVEDALDYDDRIYPRASSRLGPRHQANVTVWHGRPVELVKPADIKKKYVRGGNHKKDAKLSRETLAALEADKVAREKRPKWVIDEPFGYIPRGEDHENDDPNNTAELLFKPLGLQAGQDGDHQNEIHGSSDAHSASDSLIDDYMTRAKQLAKNIDVPDYSVNFLDTALSFYCLANYDPEIALREFSKIQKKDLKEPELSAFEVKKFEDGVTKFGSELHSVKKHVKTVSSADIVRFYYIWKKSERGKQIWGNYAGRKGKKEAKKAEASAIKLQDDVADDHDDSAFDNEKASEKKRGFQCKFCGTRNSRQWRRAPNTAAGTTIMADTNSKVSGKEKAAHLMVALCLNCAVVWRKYAVQWEESEDGKRSAQNGGRPTKRKGDEALTEFQLNEFSWTGNNTDAANTPTCGTPMPQPLNLLSSQEPVRKKAKAGLEKDSADPAPLDSAVINTAGNTAGNMKKKPAEKVTGPPPVPEVPKPKVLPCSICLQMEPLDADQHLSCRECRMTVHRNCYGVVGETRGAGKWICDMCSNDRNPQVSVHYKCTLCPVEFTEQDFVEPLKVSHKKKTEKEREKDRIERECALKTAEYYRKKQEEMGRPVNPREPLKRTANNNWVHVTCAVWTPEVKFGNAKALEPSEGIPSISAAKYDESCKACKQRDNGACVMCHFCRAPVHVECAHQQGYILGFDIAPVKGSRRDQFNIVNINGEAGIMTAAIWCKEHHPTKTIVHRMHDIVDDTGLNALQLYVRNFKQADLTLTGTVRKANLVNQSTKIASPTPFVATSNRRTSTTTNFGGGSRGSVSLIKVEEGSGLNGLDLFTSSDSGVEKMYKCVTCNVNVSPKWWPYVAASPRPSKLSRAVGVSLHFPDNLSRPSESEASLLSGTAALTNGHASSGNVQEGPKHHAALAAAALEQKGQEVSLGTGERQCHKCHYAGVRKISVSPPLIASTTHQEPLTSQPLTTPRGVPPPTLASPLAIQPASQYTWPSSQAYSPASTHGDWSRPSPIPGSSVSSIHQLNGNRSPHTISSAQQLGSQSQIRQTIVPIPVSPHMNKPPNQQVGSSYPNSPHHSIGAPHHLQNGSYISYATTRLSPQHLTSGGPPPRAPDNPFSQGSPRIHHHASFGSSQTSQPVSRETLRTSGEPTTLIQVVRPSEGRVNGGASANPSLHNLLS